MVSHLAKYYSLEKTIVVGFVVYVTLDVIQDLNNYPSWCEIITDAKDNRCLL